MRRSWLALNGDYKSTSKVSEAYHNILNRSNLNFDHVAIDVGTVTAQGGRVLRDLLGAERDSECLKFVNKTIFNTLLRRVQPKKSLCLFMDGSDPVWKLARGRIHPGKKFDSRFYRSCASPMSFMLEDKLITSLADSVKVAPNADVTKVKTLNEFIVSGPATPGPAEGKISQWLLDMASRDDVSKNDSFCLIGGADLVMSALGAVPFHNITSLMLSNADFKSMSMQEIFEWLCMEHIFSAGTASANLEAKQQLATVRTDVAVMLLMSNGISATDLNGIGCGFKEMMDAYNSLRTSSSKRGGGGGGSAGTFALTSNDPVHGTVRLHCGAVERLLTNATRKTGVPRACAVSNDVLEVLLQSIAMLCSGGIQDYQLFPKSDGALSSEKAPQLRIENFIGHLKYLASQGDGTVSPRVNLNFAFTCAEQLLFSSPNTTLVNQIFPLYSGGHPLPPAVAEELVAEKDVNDAIGKVRSISDAMTPSSDNVNDATHRASKHCPSHYYFRKQGSTGPPPGFAYQSINMGIKSRQLKTRQRFMESQTDEELVINAGAGGSRDMLAVYLPETDEWVERPCFEPSPPGSSTPAAQEEGRSTFRVLTWNTQFNRHSGETTPLGRTGIDWCTTTRHVALSHILSHCDADVIALQEVEPAWCEFLSQQPWVKEHYRMTCLKDSHAIQPWGVLMLIHNRVSVRKTGTENLPGFSGHTSVMPMVQVELSGGVPLSVCALHLLAPYTDSNVSNRVTQVQNLIKKLSNQKAVASNCIVMGDFNDYPTQFFVLPAEMRFKDAWLQLNPDAADPLVRSGYTIDGTKSTYCSLIIEPQFNGRADRILAASNRLQPVEVDLLGTTSVRDMVQSGEITLPKDAKCPEYLFPSDHFGVMAEYQLL